MPGLQAVEQGDASAVAKSKAQAEDAAVNAKVDALFESSEDDEVSWLCFRKELFCCDAMLPSVHCFWWRDISKPWGH